MQARTLKSIVESRPPKSGRAARQEQLGGNPVNRFGGALSQNLGAIPQRLEVQADAGERQGRGARLVYVQRSSI